MQIHSLRFRNELAKSTAIQDLVQKHQYILEPTGKDNSSANGRAERPHQDMGNGIRALLYGASMSKKYWEYALLHLGNMSNVTPHGDNSITPFEKITGRKPDLAKLKIFGSQMIAMDKPRDGKQSTDNHVTGKFLGYGGSMRVYYYLSDQTGKINRATHAKFDEANLDGEESKLTK